MGDFTHATRNTIRERADRIHELESVLLRARNFIRELKLDAIPDDVLNEGTRTLVALDTALMAQATTPQGVPKCKSLDCWLCHGTPANAGPR